MQDSLLPNGHLVGTGEASRQSLSQSPVLGRHGNKQRGAREMGERSQREAGRCTIISDPVTCSGQDTQPCGHPLCFTDQRTHSLLPSSVPLTQTGSTSPHTHTHTHKHTQAHTLLTHSSLKITHPHSPTHTSHTPHTLHKYIHSSHPQTPSHIHTLTHSHTHTLHTLTHTHPHTLLTCTHTHTPSQSLQEQRHRKHRDPGQCSHTRHMERVGTAQSPS